jgi:glycerol-1-phosphate dehydrogenase [NAD(P)+]
MLLGLDKAPQINRTVISETDFAKRYGDNIGRMMYAEAKKKSFDVDSAAAFNRRLSEIWPQLREELKSMMMEPEEIASVIRSAGGPTTATEMGLPRDIWRKAMKHARDVRNRWSFLDLADDAGLLDEFLNSDPQ